VQNSRSLYATSSSIEQKAKIMTTPSITTQASNPTFEYLEHDMSLTREFYQMYMTADTVSTFVYGLLLAPLSLIAITEAVLKNGLFLMYNIVAFTLNTIIDLVTKVYEFVGSFFDDGTGSTYSSISSIFGGNAQPVHTIATNFDSHDLISLKFALDQRHVASGNALEVGTDGLLYFMWYDNGTGAVNIQEFPRGQDNPILEIKITDRGRVTSIRLGGVEQDRFPEAFEICMLPCFDKAHEISSSYELTDSEIRIRTLKQSIQRIPAYHLEKFVEHLVQVQGRVPRLHVQFLESNLQRDAGIDAGGPTRDLVSVIAQGATATSRQETRHGVTRAYGKDLAFEVEVGYALKMPFARGPQAHPLGTRIPDPPPPIARGPQAHPLGTRIPEPPPPIARIPAVRSQIPVIPRLSTAFEREQYEQIGVLMVFIYACVRELTMGGIFEKAVYKAALSLTPAEASTDFHQLTEPVLLKMVRNIIEAKEVDPILIEPLDLFENPNLNEVQWARALQLLQASGDDVVDFNHDNPVHQLELRNKLKAGFWERYGRYLAPIHAIASGIQVAVARWGVDLEGVNHEQFCIKVQGLFDRETIVNSFEISGSAVRTREFDQQKEWLKDWVRTVMPISKIYDLLHFATGSRSLQPGGKINLATQSARAANRYSAMPEAHTCFNRLELCPHFLAFGNRTKDEFFETLNQGLEGMDRTGFVLS
jgi:hypothetical protein